jgi:thiol-disulfide isomerase/thioredoxin
VSERALQTGENSIDPRLLVLGAALAIAMLTLAVLLPNITGDRSEPGEIKPAAMLDPPRSPGQDALQVGARPAALAPDFEISAADGSTHRLSDFRGKPVLLTFWATWCLPCTTGRIPSEGGLLPDLHVLSQKYGDRLAIILVNRGESSGRVQSYLDQVPRTDRGRGVSFTVNGIDPDDTVYSEFYDLYGKLGMPPSFFIDPSGVITQVLEYRAAMENVEAALATTTLTPPPGG